jgi:hypothetical protein
MDSSSQLVTTLHVYRKADGKLSVREGNRSLGESSTLEGLFAQAREKLAPLIRPTVDFSAEQALSAWADTADYEDLRDFLRLCRASNSNAETTEAA